MRNRTDVNLLEVHANLSLPGDAVVPPSGFLAAPPLWEEDDYLDVDFVMAVRRDRGRSSKIARTLFHWRTARWVHEGELRATLLGR